jgi:hypothetical protein
VYAAQSEAVMAQLRAKVVQVSEVHEKSSRRSSSEESDSDTSVDVPEAKFEPIKTRKSTASDAGARASLTRVQSNTGSISEAANYNASPYDIDRVNTSTSLAGLDLTRTGTNRSVDR